VELLRRPFWFLRHGQTDWNREHRTQGSTDIPLNDTGIAQAHAAVVLLRDTSIGVIACSPLSRALDTAAIIAAALNLPLEVRADLREASFGAHEGETMGVWFAAWAAGEVVPEGGESFAQVRVRAVAALNDLLAAGPLPLVVAHGGMFRTVRAAMGFSAAVRTPNGVPLFCVPDGDAWRIEP
jgi:probable phosphoglycerate mutase